MMDAIWRKLFYSPYFFTIAIRRRQRESILSNSAFRAEYILPATYKDWQADPILADDGQKTFLFYEAVHKDKGRIEVAEVNPDCTISKPRVILEDDCHYSYPFVFRMNRQWYMIPESSAAEEVRLYKAYDFPYDWRLEQVLLRQKSVDTTVFEKDGVWYLLTFLVEEGSERVIPKAYRMAREEGELTLLPMKWEEYDCLNSRGAGPVINNNGHHYRPAQKSLEQRYGDSLTFYQIQNDENTYCESFAGTLTPESIEAKGVWMDGLHTYCGSERFEAIDIRCREFQFWKVFNAIRSKGKRMLMGGRGG